MIYIIITTSLQIKAGTGVQNAVHRENRYTECIKQLLELVKNVDGIHPIIVENNGKRETFLDHLGCDVLYTDNNLCNFHHKGGNELLDIQSVINHYSIDDNDTVIKLTGRYKVLSLDFIKLVMMGCHKIDAFAKFFDVCGRGYSDDREYCALGMLAMKCKYLKNFTYAYRESPETEIAKHITTNIDDSKILAVRKLALECCFADDLRLLVI